MASPVSKQTIIRKNSTDDQTDMNCGFEKNKTRNELNKLPGFFDLPALLL